MQFLPFLEKAKNNYSYNNNNNNSLNFNNYNNNNNDLNSSRKFVQLSLEIIRNEEMRSADSPAKAKTKRVSRNLSPSLSN